MSSVLQPMKRNGKKGDIVETGIFCITITVIFLTVYATLYLWPKFVPDKTDAEVVGFLEVPNYGYGAEVNPYTYYTILRFVVNEEEHRMILRRDKRDRIGGNVPVAYSKHHGILLRRRWMQLFFCEKHTLASVSYVMLKGGVLCGVMALFAIVAFVHVIKTGEYLFTMAVIEVVAVIMTAVITKFSVAMSQKSFNLTQSEIGAGTDAIKVYKRTVFHNKWCLYFMVGGLSWFVVLFCMWAAFPELRTFGANIFWYSVIGISVFLGSVILAGWMQIVRTNHTLKTGEVLWATIDRKESYWDMNSGVLRVSCFWFSKEDGQFYQFEGKCADLSKNVGIEMDQEIRKKMFAMGEIPVIVKGKCKKRYEVLVLDGIFSFIGDGTCRPMTCTGLLRRIPMEKRE